MNNLQGSATNKWLVMAAVSIGLFMSAVDSSIVNITLPTLQRVFRTSFASVQWVVLAYSLTVVTLMLSIGRLGDIYGRKPFYVSGFAIFTIGSLLCATSSSVTMLVAYRVLQGCGAVMLFALGAAIVIEVFPRDERGKALGIAGLMISLGQVSGPTLGGLLISNIGWESIFLINIPIGIIGTILAWRFVPVDKPAGGQRFDLAGAFCMFCALLTLLLGLTIGQSQGFTSIVVLSLFAIAITSIVAFVLVELNMDQPMINLRIFANRQLSVGLIGTLSTYISIAGVVVLLPFYLQNVLTMNPGRAGIYLAILPVAMAVSSPLSGWLSDRVGTPPIAVAGLSLMLLGYLLTKQLRESSTLIQYALVVVPIGMGMGIFQSPNNSAVMGSAKHEQLGIMSGLLAVIRNLGQTIGVALLGTLWIIWSVALQGPETTSLTAIPVHIQVLALHKVMLVVAVMIAATLAVTVWAWLAKNR